MKILMIFAMEEEAKKTVEHFEFEHTEASTKLSYCLYKKEIHGHEVYLSSLGIDKRFNVNSVGTIPAALTTFDLLKSHDFDLVINPGTAGGFKCRGGEIGDIYLPTKVLFHHRKIPMGPYEPYGLGSFTPFEINSLKENLKFKEGVFSTSDSLTCRDDELKFFNHHDVVVKEMEAGAVSYVCEKFSIPYLGVKSITDIVDGSRVTAEEFLENLEKASQNLQEFLKKLLDYFLGQKRE
jgi:5'-methylthioadenosine nucleosidase